VRLSHYETELTDSEGNVIRRPLELLVRQDEHHIAGKRLGRHLEHDPMSKLFPVDMSDRLDTASFASVLWERECDAFDQGELGSCTGNAMVGLLMTYPFAEVTRSIVGRDLTENDCIEIYKLATHLDRIPGEFPPDDTGSTGLAVAKAVKEMGLIGVYRHAFTMRAALKALQSGPVLTGFNWYDSFDEPDNHATVRVNPDSVVRGGHEVYAYGVTVEHTSSGDIDEENSYVHLWNSWGKEYGNNGRFNMTISTWRYLMKEHGDITVPTLRIPAPDAVETEPRI